MTPIASVGAPDRRAIVRARIATLALFFIAGASLGVWAAHIPLLKAGLSLDDSTLGFVMLAMGFGAVVAMPTSGALIHRFGAVPVCVASGLLLAFALSLPPRAPSVPTLWLSAFLLGLGLGCVDIAMNAHAGAVERAWGRPIMSSIHAFFSIGGLFGAGLAAGLIGLGAGAPLGMSLSGLLLAAIVVAASAWLRFAEDEPAEAGPGFRLPNAAVLGLGALAVCSFICEGAIMEWSAVFLRDVTGAPLALAAGGYAAFSAAMIIGRLVGDRVVAALGPGRTVGLSATVSAAALSVIALAPNVWVAYAGMVLAGFGFANIVPPLFSAANRVPGVAPAAALAMVASMGYAGGLVGPPVIGFLSDAIGLRFGFALLVALSAAVAIGAPKALGRPR